MNEAPHHGHRFEDVGFVRPIFETLGILIAQHAARPAVTSLETYWGHEDYLCQNEAGHWKRIFMRAGTQSSMEYHVHKMEAYYIHAGTLRVNLRTDRAINSHVIVQAGEFFTIAPGLMHQRQAITDVTIIEWASHNDPADSHIVHDGKLYQHRDGPADG